ncbi:hypothetical protein [Mesorhizobium sp. J428]|uniref:hypothetical protein n=1 Tax=Mesorhizobium sp. J428 TaxID=2898440 RepID=UPI0021509E0D|nr:hypothetical protein [Mesorhizobium sp. J428]MCR5858878.1 hypothetical protein [Mesorhizobium sp. J428]
MTRGALLVRLQELQRLPKFQNRDICTISAVLSKDALEKHVEHCERAAGLAPGEPRQAAA